MKLLTLPEVDPLMEIVLKDNPDVATRGVFN